MEPPGFEPEKCLPVLDGPFESRYIIRRKWKIVKPTRLNTHISCKD